MKLVNRLYLYYVIPFRSAGYIRQPCIGCVNNDLKDFEVTFFGDIIVVALYCYLKQDVLRQYCRIQVVPNIYSNIIDYFLVINRLRIDLDNFY